MKTKLSAAQTMLVERMKDGPIRVVDYHPSVKALVNKGIAEWIDVPHWNGLRRMLQLRKEKE